MNAPNDLPSDSSDAPVRFPFPQSRRLRRGQDFNRVYTRRLKAGTPCLLVFAETNGLPETRIGLSVSRRQGNSVARHRLRRLMREAYRLEQHKIPEGLDLVLIPGREARSATLEDFRSALVYLSNKLNRRMCPGNE